MNLLPILLAYVEYYSDTISTDAMKNRWLWLLSIPLPTLFLIWNYFMQTGKFSAMDDPQILIPIFTWEKDSGSFIQGLVFTLIQIALYSSVTAVGR